MLSHKKGKYTIKSEDLYVYKYIFKIDKCLGNKFKIKRVNYWVKGQH